jgi:hypothetical protein
MFFETLQLSMARDPERGGCWFTPAVLRLVGAAAECSSWVRSMSIDDQYQIENRGAHTLQRFVMLVVSQLTYKKVRIIVMRLYKLSPVSETLGLRGGSSGRYRGMKHYE